MIKIETDLAVVAAGPAGLAAAITGAEKGLDVCVFEKAKVAGGTANMGMGPFAVESHIQKEHMIGLTKEEAFRMMMDYTHWQTDARLVHDYFWKSADTIQWLEDMGVQFAGAMKYYPESEATWHVVQPSDGSIPGPRAASTMTKIMYERAVELGVHFYFETPVTRLLREADDIIGLNASGKDGETYEVDALSVVIATGGFGDNPKMIQENCGFEYGRNMFNFRVPGVAGDGVKMAWEAGAGKGHMEMEMILSSEVTASGEDYLFTVGFSQPRSLIVNREGERIMNEEIMQNAAESANVCRRQSNQAFYAVSCDNIFQLYSQKGVDWPSGVLHGDYLAHVDEEMQRAMEAFPGSIAIADSLEEAAEEIGIDARALRETVEEYNTGCREHFDDLYCKSRKYLSPIEGKKYYIMKFLLGAYGSLGGIKVNSRLEVLQEDGHKLYGLYAAGSDVCDLYAGTYLYKLPGNTMGFAVNSGRMAAERAAAYIDTMGEE